MAKKYLVLVIAALVLVGADQLIKLWALETLADGTIIDVLPGVFRFAYVENRGAAFGIFQGKTMLLAIVSVAVIIALVYFYKYIEDQKGVWMLRTAYIMVVAGAIGNQIDRIFRTFVVDMFEFYWFSFPVFNLADCFITVGGIAIVLLAFFKPQMVEWMFKSEKKEKANG
ncbi:MAG: signal peptidase II [Firmicutes bacterium]|nr:signal peptidase II [Bacillota bacterium]